MHCASVTTPEKSFSWPTRKIEKLVERPLPNWIWRRIDKVSVCPPHTAPFASRKMCPKTWVSTENGGVTPRQSAAYDLRLRKAIGTLRRNRRASLQSHENRDEPAAVFEGIERLADDRAKRTRGIPHLHRMAGRLRGR